MSHSVGSQGWRRLGSSAALAEEGLYRPPGSCSAKGPFIVHFYKTVLRNTLKLTTPHFYCLKCCRNLDNFHIVPKKNCPCVTPGPDNAGDRAMVHSTVPSVTKSSSSVQEGG